jgi:acyl-CoA synthetase (NDP forming)
MFGLGGIFVEVLRDVAFRVCPIDEIDADEMIREINGYQVLKGVRGRPPVDLRALKKALLQVSRLLCEHPEIAELDLNPVKLHREGLAVLDARIIVR